MKVNLNKNEVFSLVAGIYGYFLEEENLPDHIVKDYTKFVEEIEQYTEDELKYFLRNLVNKLVGEAE